MTWQQWEGVAWGVWFDGRAGAGQLKGDFVVAEQVEVLDTVDNNLGLPDLCLTIADY